MLTYITTVLIIIIYMNILKIFRLICVNYQHLITKNHYCHRYFHPPAQMNPQAIWRILLKNLQKFICFRCPDSDCHGFFWSLVIAVIWWCSQGTLVLGYTTQHIHIWKTSSLVLERESFMQNNILWWGKKHVYIPYMFLSLTYHSYCDLI